MTWGRIGVTLADIAVALVSLRGDLGALWGLWADEGDLGASWVALNSLCAHFGVTLGTVGGSFCDMAVPSGQLGMILESL